MTISQIRRYVDDTRRREDVPEPVSIVLRLLPWASGDRYSDLLRWELPVPTR